MRRRSERRRRRKRRRKSERRRKRRRYGFIDVRLGVRCGMMRMWDDG